MRDKLAQMGYTGVQVSHLFVPLYFLSCTCELSLLLKLLSAGISRELCWVGVPRGPGWKMKNRTCDQDLSRHNNWCLHLLFISISERRRIVFFYLADWVNLGRSVLEEVDARIVVICIGWGRSSPPASLHSLCVCWCHLLQRYRPSASSLCISLSRHPGHCWFCPLTVLLSL